LSIIVMYHWKVLLIVVKVHEALIGMMFAVIK